MNPVDPAARADAYVHGLLSPADVQAFERELASNPARQSELDAARRRLALLEAALPPAEASEELVRQTLTRIADDDEIRIVRRKRRRLFWIGAMAPVAAAALLISVFHIYYSNLSPTPTNLEVLGQDRWLPGTQTALRVRLTNNETREPLPNVPVDVTLGHPGTRDFVTLASFTTDTWGNGQPSFRLPDWADGRYPLNVTARVTEKVETLTRQISLQRLYSLMLTTDKPMYQPGQVIHVRCLALRRPDLKPVAQSEAIFTITDPKGNVIFRRVEKTSRFGIAAVDCALAEELIEGHYNVQVRMENVESRATVEVARYVLPKMKLAVTTEKAWYLPGQEVKGTVLASYVHGEPVANGSWSIDLTTATGGGDLLGKIAGRLDPAGRGAFTFTLPKQVLAGRDAGELALNLNIRDAAGQEQAKRVRIPAAAHALRFDLIPEGGVLTQGLANTIYIYASTPDGQPAAVRGSISLDGEEKPFSTGSLGVGRLDITPTGGPQLNARVQARDDAGRTAHVDVALPVGQISGDFLLRTNRAVYDGGQTMTLSIIGHGAQPVFIDILKNNQTIRSEVVTTQNGRGELIVDLSPEQFGTLQICAYRFDPNGHPLRKTRTVFVRPAQGLRVKATPDKAEYRPGETATIRFALTDTQGQPAPGALSLAIVDEAVFELASQRPGLERTFYLLEQELLKPVYRIYPWSPDAVPLTDERGLLEQALFAATARLVDAPISYTAIRAHPGREEDLARLAPPHSLRAGTYSQKLYDIGRARAAGMQRVVGAWVGLGAVILLLLEIVLILYVRWYFIVAVHLLLLLSLGLILVTTETLSTMSAMKGADAAAGANVSEFYVSRPGMEAARVRERFPETLLWQPQLITDDKGHATLGVELADSITTWRLSGGAVGPQGELGSIELGLRAFQPFFVDLNLPVALTRNDEIEIPAVISNYLPQGQTVTVALAPEAWFEALGPTSHSMNLAPREVKSVRFRIKATKAGRHSLRVDAKSGTEADAIRRTIDVEPGGRRVESIVNGNLASPATLPLELPADAIPDSARATLRIYPSAFSQVVDGLDGILRLPTGCFEQTSSSLYPNVMALAYLRQIGKNAPEVEAKARQYIHVGYQRLLTFEVPQGGFDWYGRPPANLTLTAYGLMEFRDMAKVHDVDAKLIDRTQQWLLSQRRSDGSWGDDSRRATALAITAYIAWAAFTDHPAHAGTTRDFLLTHAPESIADAYTLALVANALLAIDATDPKVAPYLQRLEEFVRRSPDGRLAWWDLPPGAATVFHGGGPTGAIETTAMAVLALQRANSASPILRPALAWLVEQRGPGHWGSTQATILSLKALLAAAGTSHGDAIRRIEIALDGKPLERLEIPASEAEVMKQIDLTPILKPGRQTLVVRELGNQSVGFQLQMRHHLAGEAPRPAVEPLQISLTYDRPAVRVGEPVTVSVIANNRTDRIVPMVMLDLPIPPGFSLPRTEIDHWLNDPRVGRFQITPTQIIVYLRELPPDRPLELKYRLEPATPGLVTSGSARIYEYYNPDHRHQTPPSKLTVREK